MNIITPITKTKMNDEESKAPAIHAAIRDAMRDIAAIGIAKSSQASLGGAAVAYRGIEAAMNEMCGVLIRRGITVTPRYADLQIMERAKGDPKDGKATRFAIVRGAFTFTAASDGSSVTCEHYGEAMDSGDKAVTKAQSVAFRTALFQQFVIPTMAIDPEAGGDGDGGAQSQPITAEAFNATLKALEEATTMESLRALFTAAAQAAQAADDTHALKTFTQAKDKRKAELGAKA